MTPILDQRPRKDGDRAFPVVGIGASAGGLDACRRLLQAVPSDTGMAFVLVQHLAPEHTSSLTSIMARATEMLVLDAEDGLQIAPNHVYVIPPARSLIIEDALLRLEPRERPGQARVIDHFFLSLAEERAHQAIGIILSGTANDGTAGLAAIKAAGGITFAQDDSAEHTGMPHSAIASGCVDFVRSPESIADELAQIAKHPLVAKQRVALSEDTTRFGEIIELMNAASDIDFSHYRMKTLQRRTIRRMVLTGHQNLSDYFEFLRANPVELNALCHDVLIGVTSFFRDPAAYAALAEQVLTGLMTGRSRHNPARVWVLGCSSGQEAYSLAMLLTELNNNHVGQVPLKIFATDLNLSAIERARTGSYGRDIEQEISAERLERFFVESNDGYRINEAIRELCVFARHDALKDPPFSRIDLLVCRNLLIYLNQPAQQIILASLHFGLNIGGSLWLGSTETVGRYRNLFAVRDATHRIYQKLPGSLAMTARSAPRSSGTRGLLLRAQRTPDADPPLEREADRMLLARFAPPSVLVTGELDVLQYRGDTGAYLAPASGKPSVNLLKMLRNGLLVAVRAAIVEASMSNASVRTAGLHTKTADGYREVEIEVLPVKGQGDTSRGFLIVFDPVWPKRADQASAETPRRQETILADDINASLTRELVDTREYLRSVVEQHEAANEALQAANEEVESSNEELQSANEELETSKEELQASNEELMIYNDEIGSRNTELQYLTEDLRNLLESIPIAIVIVDRSTRIRRLTPSATRHLNITDSDVGRPLSSVRLGLDVPALDTRLNRAVESGVADEIELQNEHGAWLSLRLRPYVTDDGRVDGVVLMLLDVDTLKRAQAYLESIVATIRGPLLVLDSELRVRTANRSFLSMFDTTSAQTEGRLLFELGDRELDDPNLKQLLEKLLLNNVEIHDFVFTPKIPKLGRRAMFLDARLLIQAPSENPLILVSIDTDLTAERRLVDIAEHQATELRQSNRRKDEFIATLAHELRNPLASIVNSFEAIRLAAGRDDIVETASMALSRQLAHLQQLIDDLLDAGRVSSGKFDLHPTHHALAQVIDDALDAVRPFYEHKQQALSVGGFDRNLRVVGDQTRLTQVVENILDNASKFTPPGGQIVLSVELEGTNIVIRVRDSGIGIEAAQAATIFDMFMQIDSSLERANSGLGIGLTLVKTIVELHRGSVEVHSRGPGLGSEFTLRLPILDQSTVPTTRTSENQLPTVSRRILIVDDNRDGAESLARVLELFGHTVSIASDGDAALSAAAEFTPDLILLDIGLPKLNGFEVARKIRKEAWGQSIVLIALTGWGHPEHRRESAAAGFDAHLLKPVRVADLLRALATPPMHASSPGGSSVHESDTKPTSGSTLPGPRSK